MGDLDGVGALVTGAASGLGRGMALGLGRRGARVVFADIDEDGAGRGLEELEAIGGSGLARALDVTDPDSVKRVVGEVARMLDGIDLVVNNAGVISLGPVAAMEVSEWRRVMEVNSTGVFLVSQAVLHDMLNRGTRGSIISISSINGKRGDPGLAHYAASKHAVLGFTRSLAYEVADRGVTVNALCPSVVMTPLLEELARASGKSPEEFVQEQIIKRPQEPDELAAAVAFLHGARSITGQAINVDGGTVFS